MRSRDPLLVSVTVALMMFTSCSGDNTPEVEETAGFVAFSGPYFGLESPGDVPEIFMPGLVSTLGGERCVTFLDGGKVCLITRDEGGSLYTYEKDGKWTAPQAFPYNYKEDMLDNTSGPDDRSLYFMTSRPISPEDTDGKNHLWRIEWTGEGWGEPVPLPAPDKASGDGSGYPTASSDGTLYFISGPREGFDDGGIYRCEMADGVYGKAELVGAPINGKYIDYDPYVGPDGSYIIFNSNRPGGYGYWDSYICFRNDDGSWTEAINIGPGYNSSSPEACPNVSADGRYFFFVSTRRTDTFEDEGIAPGASWKDIYWVGTGFIERLRERYANTRSSADAIRQAYKSEGLESAIDLLNELYSHREAEYSFMPNELLPLCEEMIVDGKSEDAERFYQAVSATLQETMLLKLGYGVICAMNGDVDKGMDLVSEAGSAESPETLEDNVTYLAELLELFDKAEEALVVCRFLSERYPDSYKAFYVMAKAYNTLGDTASAIENCRRALELKPGDRWISALLARLEANQ